MNRVRANGRGSGAGDAQHGQDTKRPVKAPSPAFSLYPKDILADENCSAMTHEEFGAYMRLLCHAWLEGSIPAEPVKLQRILRIRPQKFARIWPAIAPCFTEQEDRLIQCRLEQERSKQRERSDLSRVNGLKGGRPTLSTKRKSHRLAEPNPDESFPSSSSSSSTETENRLPPNPLRGDVSVVFAYWQSVMGHSDSNLTDERRRKIEARLREGSTVDQIKAAIDGCRASAFHMGENDAGKRHDDITLICRSGSKLDWFRQNAPANGPVRVDSRPMPPPPTEAEMEASRRAFAAVKGSFGAAK